MKLFETTAVSSAEVATEGGVAEAVMLRANVFEMTQAAEDAVLRPKETGSWAHSLRAALAARIARLNDEEALAARLLVDAGELSTLADPAEDGAAENLRHVVTFMDKVAAETRNVREADIRALQAAGVPDDDIVRLAELNAFMAYQIRVIAGLRLMQAGTP